MINKTALLTFADRFSPLKRFLYPVLVVLLLAFAITGFPLPVALQGWPLLVVVGLGLLALTFYWFEQVGPRLHERDWRLLATELNLVFEPPTSAEGETTSARVSGQYRGRQVSLETFRLVSKRDGRENFFMHCAVSISAPAGTVLALHGGNPKDKKKGLPLQSGDANFDKRFVLDESQPADLARTLFSAPALRQRLSRLARRPVWLRLKEGQLVYQDQRSQFFGVEMDRTKLKELLNLLCDLSDTINH